MLFPGGTMLYTAVGSFLSCSLLYFSLWKLKVCPPIYFARSTLVTFDFPGRTLEETAALFDGDDHQEDIQVMGGQAADISSRLSRGVVLPELEPETRQISESEEKVNEYYEMKKRYRDSDNTGSSSNTNHWRAI